jgi:hypothetical protein
MRAMLRCISVVLLGVMLGSCAWQATPHDRAHVISELADKAASDDARCRLSGAAPGSVAYRECRKRRWASGGI